MEQKKDMLEVLDNFHRQCEEASRLGKDIQVELPINGIVFCGIGGSAFPGAILNSYIDIDVPVVVNRGYTVPKWVNKHTLVFVVSYSGNTEETLAAYREAFSRKAKIVGLASGGKLKELCSKHKTPFIEVPKGLMPRDAMGYQTLPLINVLQNSKLIPDKKIEILETIHVLKKNHKDKAKELAKKLVDKIPLIYSSQEMECIARIWKIKINENAKTEAFFNVFPELNHNEIESFTNIIDDLFVIIIKDTDDFHRIKKRMDVMKELLQERDVSVLELKLTGTNKLARIFSSVLLCSYIGYYLALEYDTDPNEIPLIEDFKERILK